MEEIAECKNWEEMKVLHLRIELKRRGLPHKGLKETLLTRLKRTDGLPMTYDGRKAYHESKAKEYRAVALEKATIFPHFIRIPTEIREYIWEFSLPGPRVLKFPNDGPICEHRLYFPKEGQPPNPAALGVCRESRFVALKRFKLCFGTTNIYANLPGGDMLYMSNPDIHWKWTQSFMLSGQRRSTQPAHKALCEDVVRDLESVKHVILSATFWRRSLVPMTTMCADGIYTRNCLSKLKSLERVSLGIDPKFETQRVFAGYCKHSDPLFERPQIHLGTAPFDKELETFIAPHQQHPHETFADWKERRERILGDTYAAHFVAGFDLVNLSRDEVEQGTPEIRVVKIKHIPYIPRRVEEEDQGYPLNWCCDGRDDQAAESDEDTPEDDSSEGDTSEEDIFEDSEEEVVSGGAENRIHTPRTNSRYSLRGR